MENHVDHPIVRLTNVLALTIVVLLVMLSLIGGFVLTKLNVTPSDVLYQVGHLQESMDDVKNKLDRSNSESQILLEVLEESGVATIILDKNGVITFWSKGAEELFGIDESNALGFGPGFIMKSAERSTHYNSFARSMNRDSHPFHRTINCEARHSEGHYIEVTIDIWAVPDRSAIAIFTPSKQHEID